MTPLDIGVAAVVVVATWYMTQMYLENSWTGGGLPPRLPVVATTDSPAGRPQVRLRDIPKLDRYGLVNVAGAVLSFATAGTLLGTAGVAIPLDAAVVVLLAVVGMLNVYVVDRELREVSA